MKKVLIVAIAFFLLSACTMPETKIYSIYITEAQVSSAMKEETTGPMEKISAVSLDVVATAPRYLSQPYIAYRNSPYQLRISKYSKWDSSPRDMIQRALKETLSAGNRFKEVRASTIVPEGFYSLEIDLKRFERYDEGNTAFADLVLDAKLLSPENEEIDRIAISKRVKLRDSSFLGLAVGLSQAVNEAVQQIRETVLVDIRKL